MKESQNIVFAVLYVHFRIIISGKKFDMFDISKRDDTAIG